MQEKGGLEIAGIFTFILDNQTPLNQLPSQAILFKLSARDVQIEP